MAKLPMKITVIKTKVSAPKPMAKPQQNRPAPLVTQGKLDRDARRQGEEARSEALLLKRGRPDIIRTTVNMRATPAKKNK